MLDDAALAGLGPRFSTFQARRAGIEPAQLRFASLASPFHGVRMLHGAAAEPEHDRFGSELGPPETLQMRKARAFATVMSDHQFFSHVTAAVIWGIWVPRSVVTDDIDIGVHPPNHLPRGRGYKGHEVRERLVSVVTDPRTGLRVTSPASTWAMLASVLTNPYDVVAAGDSVIRTWRVAEPLGTVGQLERVTKAGRRVGIPRLRDALPRIRTGSASRPEVWLRLTLVDAGLAEPALNHDVIAGGVKLACVDLAYPDLKIAIEYEGGHHLKDPAQWAFDIRRYEALEAAGWIVVRVTKTDLFAEPEVLVARVRDAVARRR